MWGGQRGAGNALVTNKTSVCGSCPRLTTPTQKQRTYQQHWLFRHRWPHHSWSTIYETPSEEYGIESTSRARWQNPIVQTCDKSTTWYLLLQRLDVGVEINTNLSLPLWLSSHFARLFTMRRVLSDLHVQVTLWGVPQSTDRKPSRAFLDIYSFAAVDPTKPGIRQVHSSPATVSSLVLSSSSYRFQEIYTTQYCFIFAENLLRRQGWSAQYVCCARNKAQPMAGCARFWQLQQMTWSERKTCTAIPFKGIQNVHDNQLLWLSNASKGHLLCGTYHATYDQKLLEPFR